jgi:hypothetical protein
MPDAFTDLHRAPIILATARNNVPAVYPLSEFVRDGGLLSYGPDRVDIWRRAATYVDRILRGEKPGDLPVQFPTKLEMVLNLKTGKRTLGNPRRAPGMQGVGRAGKRALPPPQQAAGPPSAALDPGAFA